VQATGFWPSIVPQWHKTESFSKNLQKSITKRTAKLSLHLAVPRLAVIKDQWSSRLHSRKSDHQKLADKVEAAEGTDHDKLEVFRSQNLNSVSASSVRQTPTEPVDHTESGHSITKESTRSVPLPTPPTIPQERATSDSLPRSQYDTISPQGETSVQGSVEGKMGSTQKVVADDMLRSSMANNSQDIALSAASSSIHKAKAVSAQNISRLPSSLKKTTSDIRGSRKLLGSVRFSDSHVLLPSSLPNSADALDEQQADTLSHQPRSIHFSMDHLQDVPVRHLRDESSPKMKAGSLDDLQTSPVALSGNVPHASMSMVQLAPLTADVNDTVEPRTIDVGGSDVEHSISPPSSPRTLRPQVSFKEAHDTALEHIDRALQVLTDLESPTSPTNKPNWLETNSTLTSMEVLDDPADTARAEEKSMGSKKMAWNA